METFKKQQGDNSGESKKCLWKWKEGEINRPKETKDNSQFLRVARRDTRKIGAAGAELDMAYRDSGLNGCDGGRVHARW